MTQKIKKSLVKLFSLLFFSFLIPFSLVRIERTKLKNHSFPAPQHINKVVYTASPPLLCNIRPCKCIPLYRAPGFRSSVGSRGRNMCRSSKMVCNACIFRYRRRLWVLKTMFLLSVPHTSKRVPLLGKGFLPNLSILCKP